MSLLDDEEEFQRDLIKVGEVSSVDYENGTARVVFDDEEGYVSNDLQVIQKNTIENQDYWMPDVGEDVLCLFIPNGEEDGFILGSFYADEIKPPKSGENKRYVKFKDEAEVEYDWSTHKLTIVIGKTKIVADESSVNISGSSNIKVEVPNIDFIGNLKVDGNIETTGNVTADGNMTATGEVTTNILGLPVNLSTHIHNTSVGPSANPTPGT